MGILLDGRVRLHWLLLQLLTNNRKFLFSESFPFRPHKDISEIGHSLNMRKRLTYIYIIVDQIVKTRTQLIAIIIHTNVPKFYSPFFRRDFRIRVKNWNRQYT